jgi:hypothetical protein
LRPGKPRFNPRFIPFQIQLLRVYLPSMKATRAANSTPARKRSEISLSKLRSSISNGSTILPDIDHRSAWMRRLRDLIVAHTSDLGGHDFISTSEQILVRRAAMLTLQCELMEHRWATEHEGQASSQQIETYQRCTNTLRRTLESLGLRRHPRDVTPPHPLDYARTFDEQKAAVT